MSERDKKLLIYLGAFLILAAGYFLVGKPYLDKIEGISNQKMELEQTLSKKEAASNNQEKYLQGIDDAKATSQKIFDEFPEDITDEKSLMFASHAETEIPIWFSQVKFADEEQMVVNTEASSENPEGEVVEEATSEEASEENENAEDETAKEKKSLLDGMMWRRTDLGLTFSVKYDGFKKFLAYIRDYDDRIVIKEMDVTYDPLSGIVGGSVILSQYALLGDDRVLPEVKTDVKNIGTKNIFTNENHGGTIVDLVANIMTDLLEAVLGGVSDEVRSQISSDYFVKLNAVTDNTNGKTIGRGDDIIGATNVTSDNNSKEDIVFNIAGSDGEYRVTYSVGSRGYVDKIEKDADGKIDIRIISTERYSNDDEVAAKIHIINKSDIPVNVYVEGDDSANPRVDIVERSGDVTVK